MKRSWGRLEDVFRLCLQKTSSRRRLQDVLVKTNMFALVICLQKTYSRSLGQDQYIRLGHTSSSCPQDIFKTSSRYLAKMSSRRLAKTSSRNLQDVFKTFWRRLQDVFKTSSRRLAKIFLRRFQGISSSKLFLLTRFWEVFNTFLRRSFPKMVIYRGIRLGNTTSEKFMVSVQNLRGR